MAPLETQTVVPVVEVRTHLKRLLCEIIETHRGIVYKFGGEAVFAYWHPRHTEPNHAQLAFDAGCAILDAMSEQLARSEYAAVIVLGTGELQGAEIGPTGQFQITGKGIAVAECLARFHGPAGSRIRASQYTAALIGTTCEFHEMGSITRDSLEYLRVFLYH